MRKVIEVNQASIIRNGRPILSDITWQMQAGESWAVVGENGSGKSFLLRLIAGGEYPTHGRVSVLGSVFGSANLWELRRRLGFVSDSLQTRYHARVRVADVVLSGFFSSIGLWDTPSPRQQKLAGEVLVLLGIQHLAHRLFGELSQGEQRKVLIARSLVPDPELLILDEPCAGLDFPTREEFLSSLQHLIERGRNLVVVTHHIEEIVTGITHILLMKNGRIAALGPKEEVMTEELLNRVLGYRFSLVEAGGRYWAHIIH